ncbi:interleukin-20-like [Lithobates pipiens]
MKRYVLCIASVFLMYINIAMSRVLFLPTCEVSPTSDQITEIREIFNTIRSSIKSQDKFIHTQTLVKSSLEKIPPSDQCCFLQKILHFYMTNVFQHDSLLDTYIQASSSKIANSICALTKVPCQFSNNCKPSTMTMKKLEIVEQNFKKLNLHEAVTKAFRELDILLTWMESLQ